MTFLTQKEIRMKKWLLGIIGIILILSGTAIAGGPSFSGGGGSGGAVITASDCDIAAYYAIGKLCQDTDDGTLYKGTGTGILEIASGASTGDTVAPATTTLNYIPLWSSTNKTLAAGVAPGSANGLLYTNGTTWARLGSSANMLELLGSADYATARTNLGLVISTNVQAYDADLTTYAGITPSANVQSVLSAANNAAIKTLLGYYTSGDAISGTFTGSLTGSVTGNVSGSSGSCTGNSATATLATNATNLTDADHGDFTCSSGTCTNDTGAITVGKLATSMAIPNGALWDFSAIVHGSTTPMGLKLPTWTNNNPSSGAGYITWDSASSSIKVYDSGWKAFATAAAPLDATYLTTTTDGTLTNEANLGALTTGLLKISVAGGVATPSTASAGTDYAAATSGTSILKGNGSGGFSNATFADVASGTNTTGTLTIGSGGSIATTGTGAVNATTLESHAASYFQTALINPLIAAGTQALTANWDVGSYTITALTFVSDVATGTAPFTVASTTNVANLNASSLSGATFAAPGAIGSSTPSTGAFTTGTFATTLSAGAAGFTVDADGDVVAKSVTIAKVNGVPGQSLMYSSHSTDITGAGWQGPSSVSGLANSYYLSLPEAEPTVNQVLIAGTPSSHVSAMTWGGPYLPLTGGTLTGVLITNTPASGASGYASVRLPHGAAPTTNITNGDCWTTTSGLYCYINGSTVGPYAAAGGSPALDDVTNPDAAKTFTLLDNNASSLSFGSTGKAGILTIITTDAGEGVTMSGTLGVTGALTAASINGHTFTTGSSTFTGTAGQTYTFPTTTATLARTDAANTFTGHQTIEGVTSTGATGTGKLVFGTAPTFTTSVALPATITNAAAATWTLLDNNASGLTIDATGKTGIIKVVTTDGSEGVTMSGTLGVTSTLTAGSIELGAVSDTTLARVSAGVVSIAGVNILLSGGALGTPSGGTLTNATGLPVATGISGLGTGVATGLAVNIGSAGAPVLFNGAGGTPTSLNLSNAVMNSAASVPDTCTVGQLFQDTNADTDGSVYFCKATDQWKEIDDDGGAGGMATTDMDTSAEVLGIVTDETGSASGTPLLVFNQAPRIDNIELGAATDTTIHRESAGVVSIEGATILTNTVPAVFDGSAASNLTAASMSDPRCTVSNFGQTTADVAVTLPTAAANLSCLFNVGTAQSGNKWGVRANTNDKIYLIAAAGTISAGDDNGYARMTAAQVGQSFACWSFTTGSGAYDWQCKAISIGTSTFVAN